MRATILLLGACGVAVSACGNDESTSGSAATSSVATTTTGTGGSASASTTGSGGMTTSSSSSSMTTTTTTSTGTTMTTACSGTACDITFNGTGFNAREGLTVYANAVEQGVNKNGVDWTANATITGGAFSLMGSQVLVKGKAYFLDYFVDVNGNATCDITPNDDVWKVDLGVVQDNIVITLPYNMNFANLGCTGF